MPVREPSMQVRDVALLRRYIGEQNQTRLAENAQCSRQFIHKLTTGQRTSCAESTARRIEETLRVLPGTLFVAKVSPTIDTPAASRRTRSRTAATA